LRYVALDSSGIVTAVAQTQTNKNNVVLTEHTNEEDDYEKPTCKRLEEAEQH